MTGKRKATSSGQKQGQKSAPKTASPGKGKGKSSPPKAPRKPRTRWGQVRRVLLWLLVIGLVGALLVAGGLVYLYKTTEIPKANDAFETETTFVLYSNGEDEIGRYAVQDRVVIGYDEIPQYVKDGVVAAENQSFWTDKGLDPKGILRAAFSNAQGNATQGASTITQQYVKILYLTQERSYQRKLKEAILSLKVHQNRTKEEILGGYLNTIYFGRGAYGIQTASQAYFRKDAETLNLRESAVLSSVINNPTRFDPANGRQAKRDLRERYRHVLDNMAGEEMVTAEEAEEAARKLPTFPPIPAESTYGGQRGHVLKMVRDELLRLTDEDGDPLLTEDEIDGGGLSVTTTFTKKAMDAATEGVAEARPEGNEFSDKELHVGVASVEPGTGAIRGIYGGQDYLESQLNWAVAGGQAGSSLKPFALSAGIKQGFSLKDTFYGNSPIELPDGTEIENQGNEPYGSAVNLIKATASSVNTAYIDLTLSMDDGPEAIVKQANLMGVPSDNGSKVHGFPDASPGLVPVTGVALGNATVSPINMANGYATIANDGEAAEPYIIESVVNSDGDTLYEHQVNNRQAMTEDIAADVSYALQQVVEVGSGTTAQELDRPAAGKTGTSTNDAGDVVSAWFTGYTPQLATSVVYVRGKGVGKLDGWLPSFFGGAYPADTWLAVMSRAMEGVEVEEFPEPVYVDGEAPDDGHAPTPPPSTPKPTPSESETESEEPTEEPTKDPTPTPTPTPTPSPTDSCLIVDCPSESPTESPTQSPTDPSSPAPRAREVWWSLRW